MATARDYSAGLATLRGTYERTLDGWLRPGLNGWRLTDTQGNVYRLSDEDGSKLYAEAREKIAELFSSLEGRVWYMLIPAVLVACLGLRMANEFVLYGAMPSAVYFVPCLAFLFKDAITEMRFLWEMNLWRSELVRRVRLDSGREAEPYSLLKDERLGVWAGWVLFGPGVFGLLLGTDYPDFWLFSLLAMGAGIFVLRGAYGLD